MAKRKDPSELPAAGGGLAQKALLFEIAGNECHENGSRDEVRTQRIAGLSLEETIRYMRARHPSFEIAEVKVVGIIQVLSSSEHL
jgi:hypothetical protein